MHRRIVVLSRIDIFRRQRFGQLVARQAKFGCIDGDRKILVRTAVVFANFLKANARQLAKFAAKDGDDFLPAAGVLF